MRAAGAAPARPTGRLRRAVERQLLYRLIRWLQPWPQAFFRLVPILLPQAQRRIFRARAVAPDSDLVVEGAQRSANTYLAACFAVAAAAAGQPPLRIAQHLHAAPQFARAARWQLPAVLLLRSPEDCARSTVLLHPALSPAQVLKSWVAFHRAAWRWRDALLVVPFERAAQDPGSVIAATNRRFGRGFPAWPGTPLARADVLHRLQAAGPEALTAFLPSDAKEVAKRRVDLSGCAGLLARAAAEHRRWLRLAEASFAAAERLDRPTASP